MSSHMLAPSGTHACPFPAVEFSRKGPQLEPAVGLAQNKAFFVRLWHARQPPSPRPGQAGARSPCPRWHGHGSERLGPRAKAAQQAGQSGVARSVFSSRRVPERRGCVQAPLPPSPSRAWGVSAGEVEPEAPFAPPHPKPKRRGCRWTDRAEAWLAELHFRPLLLPGRAFPGVAWPGGSDGSCPPVPFRPPAPFPP